MTDGIRPWGQAALTVDFFSIRHSGYDRALDRFDTDRIG
jgi:hypothetical protein